MGQISTRLIVIALLSVTAMSLVPVLIRFTSANIETIGTARLAISLVALTPLVLFTGQLRRPTRGDWGWLMAAGLCFGLHWWTYFYAIKSAGAAAGAIAMSTFGIHLLLLNRIVHRHPVRLLDGLMVALCIVGCYLVVPEPSIDSRATLGFLVGVFSAFLYGAMPLMHRRIIHLPTTTRTWGQFAFAALFFLALWPETDWQLTPADWWALLVLGTLCTLFAHALWVKASTELPGIITSSIHYLYPPMTVVQSYFFLGETITVATVAGTALIIGANLVLLAAPWLRLRKRAR
ncbi:MAG: DMT family transporter [Porticoccaceae bacterium]